MEGRILRNLNLNKLAKSVAMVNALLLMSACTALPKTSTPSSIPEAKISETKKSSKTNISQVAEPPEVPVPPTDMWEVMRREFKLETHIERPEVQAQITFFSQHQSYLNRVSARAKPFMYFIVEELKTRDMPLELALLPIVESAFDPFAYSHGRASGLWQFIPSTGTYFGLDQTWWYDGRRDPIAATDAALTYLDRLQKRFNGDWELAVASYNGGGGRVNRAITRNRNAGAPTDFWSLDLPAETEGYVPKLLALSELIAHPEKYGISLPEIPNEAFLAQVNPGTQVDIKTAADLVDMEESDFRALNAGYTKWATSPNGHQSINLPISKVDQFNSGLANLPIEKRVKFERYKIQPGDALSTIAREFRTQVDAIQAYNDIRGTGIRAGDYLLIPIPAAPLEYYESGDWERLASAQKRGGSKGAYRIEYAVASGDSLWELAREYSVTVGDIARWNNMAPTDPIRPGQTLVFWKKNDSGAHTRRVTYSVRQGDSLARIAQRFKVTVKELKQWNQAINQSKYIQPGQRITIFVDTNNQS